MVVTVDFSEEQGKIKPLHGMGNGPFTADFSRDHRRDFARAKIPFCRLHDSEYPKGSGKFVDIHCIFPDMDKNPEDPDAYHFDQTDRYLQAILETGSKVIYRLGESIDHNPVKEFVFPPKDYEKWACVCEHIISHYTEGWAEGFEWDMPFWEIWNEPDNEPEIAKNPMWQGTEQQYFDLYVITANRLKKRFPHLMIGGYASCGFYAVTGTDASAVAKSSPRMEYFVEFAHRFLCYITDPAHKAPLDFFSWHSYAQNPEENVKFALYARNLLDHYGFFKALSILDEWNPRAGKVQNIPEEAAAIASHFCALSKAPLDIAAYYDGRPGSGYCGLFDARDQLLCGYDAFLFYGDLYASECAVKTVDVPPVYTLACKDKDFCRLLLVNYSGAPVDLSLAVSGAGKYVHHITCRGEKITLKNNQLSLSPWQMVILSFEKEELKK